MVRLDPAHRHVDAARRATVRSSSASTPHRHGREHGHRDLGHRARQPGATPIHRTPGWRVGGTHYTYTNSVIFNDIVFIPSFSGYATENAQAVAVFQAAFPGQDRSSRWTARRSSPWRAPSTASSCRCRRSIRRSSPTDSRMGRPTPGSSSCPSNSSDELRWRVGRAKGCHRRVRRAAKIRPTNFFSQRSPASSGCSRSPSQRKTG